MNRSTIGGYLGVTSQSKKSIINNDGIKLQSARACLYLFLSSVNCKKLYIPNLRCDVIDDIVTFLDIDFEYYEVSHQLQLPEKMELNDDEFVIITNYFGISSDEVDRFLSTHDKRKVILDNAQAYYSKVRDCACNIYSVRKFLGVTDGGILYANCHVEYPEDVYYPKNIEHLILDLSNNQSFGYDSYLKSEEQLKIEFKPKKMSLLSERLMTLYDDDFIKKKRLLNYKLLSEEFGGINNLKIILREDDIPICYPLHLGRSVETICSDLASRGIFLPRYWPSKLENSEIYSNCLFLPIDQRINSEQLRTLIINVRELIL